MHNSMFMESFVLSMEITKYFEFPLGYTGL